MTRCIEKWSRWVKRDVTCALWKCGEMRRKESGRTKKRLRDHVTGGPETHNSILLRSIREL